MWKMSTKRDLFRSRTTTRNRNYVFKNILIEKTFIRGSTKADFFFSGKTQRIEISSLQNFPVVIYGCESWTIKKTECQRIDPFELWYWRSLLKIPWIARSSNQSLLKEINPAYSLEGLMLKLKFQYFCIQSSDANRWLIGKVPDAGKDWGEGEEGVRGWDGWMVSPMQ